MQAVENKNEKFRFRHLPELVKATAITWNKGNPWRLSAVVAYYAILSMPGLLVVIISLVGYIWGAELVKGEVYSHIKSFMGASAAASAQSMFEHARDGSGSLVVTIIGIAALVYGATGVFYHLQISINEIWGISSAPKNEILKYVLDRARGFGFVLIIGFLLMVSFVISAIVSALQNYVGYFLPEFTYLILQGTNFIFSLGVITLLFALIFKYLPDVDISWRSVWVGAFITSVLFAIGKEILSYYFGVADPGNAYGAAGSIIIILLWVSYTSLILFFGAEFTWVFTIRYGLKLKLSSHARFIKKNETTAIYENE